jgi:hypothetical protein
VEAMRHWFRSTSHSYMSILLTLPPPQEPRLGPLLVPEALQPGEQHRGPVDHGQAPAPPAPDQVGSHRPEAVPGPRYSSGTPLSSVGTAAELQTLI